MLSSLFEKRVPLFRKRDKKTWSTIKKILKEERVKGVSSGHYQQERIIAGGCASQLDPRDWSSKGKIDREIYYVNVKKSYIEQARKILRQHGIKADVESSESLMKDAPDRIKPHSGI